jgi:flagellin-like protein
MVADAEHDRGVNSVIAVVLMLAVVIVAAAATALIGFDIASVLGGEPAPQTNVEFAYDAEDGVIRATHGGGDALSDDDTGRVEVVVVDASGGKATYEWANGSSFSIESGDAFTLNSTASSAAGNATHRPGFDSGDRVRVTWVSPDGDRSVILASYRVTTAAAPSTRLTSGLRYEYYEASGEYLSMPDFDASAPTTTGIVARPDISVRERNEDFAFEFTGYVKVPTDGTYTFYTTSDDGSELYINGSRVVDNRGRHADRERSGTVRLDAGYHEITVTHFEHHGQETLSIAWDGPGFGKQQVPSSALYREPVLVAAMDVDCFDTSCSFSGSPSTNGGAGIDGYEWTFGDGASATGENVTHEYASTGTYDVTLEIETPGGRTRSVTRTVTVDAAKEPADPESTAPGLEYGYYEGTYQTMPSFPAGGAVANGTASNVGVDAYASRRGENFAYRFVGYVEVPENGTYTFWTGSDDGSYLYIDGERVVSNGGLHAYNEESGEIDLEAGNHTIVVTMYEHTGQEVLDVYWSGPNFRREPIPDANLTHNDSDATIRSGRWLGDPPDPNHVRYTVSDLGSGRPSRWTASSPSPPVRLGLTRERAIDRVLAVAAKDNG